MLHVYYFDILTTVDNKTSLTLIDIMVICNFCHVRTDYACTRIVYILVLFEISSQFQRLINSYSFTYKKIFVPAAKYIHLTREAHADLSGICGKSFCMESQ